MNLADCLGTQEEKRLLAEAGLAAGRLVSLRAWTAADVEDRRAMIARAYDLICQVFGLKRVSLTFDSMWRDATGRFDPYTGQIVLSEELVNQSDPSDTIKTLAHEGRHAFQIAALDHEIAVSPEILAAWDEAEVNYPRRADFANSSEFFNAYQRNALEIDAWETEQTVYAGYTASHSSS